METLDLMKEFLINNNVHIHNIDDKRNYWFVRTDGGNYFDAYISGSYVALGWNDVPLTEADEKGNYPEDLLKEIEAKGNKQPTRVLNQINRFYHEMKKGDVVVIPSTASLNLAFGYIAEDDVYEETNITKDDIENGACPYQRRRKVDWMVNIDKARIDPHLYALFRNHLVISYGNNYAEYIDRALHTLYIKNNVAHLTFTVEAKQNPKALSIPTFIFGLMARTDELAKEINLFDDGKSVGEKITTKINVQSPGVIEFLGDIPGVIALAIVSVGLFGGNAKFEHTKEKTSGEVSTEGLAGAVIKILKILKDNNYVGDKNMLDCKNQLEIKDITDDKNENH